MSFPRTRRRAGVRRFAVVGLTSLAAMVGVLSALSSAQAGTAPKAGATTPAAKQPTILGCAPKYLCLYRHANFNNYTGPNTALKDCDPPYNLRHWVTRHGSYINNQVGRVVSKFYSGYDGTGKLLRTSWNFPRYTTEVYGWWDADFDFLPVNSIDVC